MWDIFLKELMDNLWLQAAALWIVFDTIMGCCRAATQHEFNSSFGINGGIRKAGMLISLVFLMSFDVLSGFNILKFIPEGYREIWGSPKIGTGEFFAALYFAYESISILKNMYILGIPMPAWMKTKLEKFLKEMTGELKEK
jgi:toxin secretion/phage lysis holin